MKLKKSLELFILVMTLLIPGVYGSDLQVNSDGLIGLDLNVELPTFNNDTANVNHSNSSDWWDNLNTPSDISASDITDDGVWRTLANGTFTFDINANNITAGNYFVGDATFLTGIGVTPFNGSYVNSFWAARGTVTSNNYWAWGNGQTPQGSGVGFDSKLVKIQATCKVVGTTLNVTIRKNDVYTGCDVTVTTNANTVYEDTCDVDFVSTDIVGIYAQTEVGTYSNCIGTSFLEYNMSLTGLKGDTGSEGSIETPIDNLTIYDFLTVNGTATFNETVNITGTKGGDFIINNTQFFVDTSTNMIGLGTTNPQTGFHSKAPIGILIWTDGVTRSSSNYFSSEFVSGDVGSLTGMLGVDAKITGGTSGIGINAVFNVLSIGDIGEAQNYLGSAMSGFTSVVSANVDWNGLTLGAITSNLKGSEGRIFIPNDATAHPELMTGFVTGVEGIIFSLGAGNATFSGITTGLRASAVIADSDFIDLRMGHSTSPTGVSDGIVTQLTGYWIDEMSAGSINYGLVVDSDTVGTTYGDDQGKKIHSDGTDLIINPKVVGTGLVQLLGGFNQTLGNATINMVYGEAFHNTTNVTVIDILASQTYVILNSTFNITADLGNGDGWNGTGFKTPIGGVYSINYYASLSGTVNDDIHFSIGLNNNVSTGKCHSSRDLGSAGVVGNMGGNCFVRTSDNDILYWLVENNDDASDINLFDGGITIIRIGN